MIPLTIAGIALAGSTFFVKKNRRPLPGKNRTLSKQRPRPIRIIKKRPATPNPLQNIFKGITSSLSKFTQKSPKEDYNDVIRRMLPENATLLTPSHPAKAEKYQLVDLDGDLQNELVTTYRVDNMNRVLILKKRNDQWGKVAEISNPKFTKVNFINFADLDGQGKKQLLLGCKTKDNLIELHAYSLENESAKELFSRNCDWAEVDETTTNRGIPSKAHLALWNKKDADAYDIEVMGWNGSELEPVSNQVPYYYQRVLPYYGRKVKQMPQNPSNWYYLAEALLKSEMYRDALISIDMGLRFNPVSPSRDDFYTLRKAVLDKMDTMP